MPQAAAFEAISRQTTGTGSARELRRQGRVPAVIYADGKNAPLHVSLPLKELSLRSNKKNFKSTIFELKLDGKNIKVIPKDITFHPVTDIPEHVDLQIVSDKAEIKAFVPVAYINQLKSPGLKKGGVLNIVAREIELYCNPDQIPTQIEVSLTGMEIGHARHIKDIKLPAGVKPVNKMNFTLATVVGKGAEEEETTVAVAEVLPGAVPAAAGMPAPGAPGAPGTPGAPAAPGAPGAAPPAAPGAAPAADAKKGGEAGKKGETGKAAPAAQPKPAGKK